MRTIIIDDERKSIDLILWLAKEYCPQLNVIACFTSAEIALEEIDSLFPDLIFLDIKMSNLTGFGLAKALGGQRIKVIYITAFFGPLIKEMKCYNLYYLLKPVDPDDFQQVVLKASSTDLTAINLSVFDELNQWV